MPTRVGIELTPVACRIVEIEAGPMWRRHVADTRVRSFARFPLTSPRMRAKLASLRGRQAAVVAWGLPSDHRQVVVTNGPNDRMRLEALAALRAASVDTRGMLGDILPAASPVAGTGRRPVVVAIAAANDVSSAVQPLVDAGLDVRAVVTPALALTSLARLRRALAGPDVTEAYVALEESAMSFALVRDGALVAARDFEWGYLDGPSTRAQPRPREEIAARLADELVKFFGEVGAGRGSVTQVCICGGLPELRSMTAPLMERLDLEVETLDSLFAIDAARLPEPAAEFRDRSAELRLAWAVAADWPTPINLLRERNRRRRRTALARAGVAAGVAVGLGIGWRFGQSAWWRSAESKPVAVATPPASRLSTAREPAPAAKPAPLRQPPPVVNAAPPPVAQPAEPPKAATVTSPSVPGERAERAESARREEPPQREATPSRQREQTSEPAPLPFDAALGTILYAPDRKLAIIDGRIVQPGDDVRGAQVVEISPAAVLLRDAQGRLHRLALGRSGR